MNSDLAPAIVAAGGGAAMIAGIWLREHRQREAMRASRVRLGMRFPAGLEPPQVLAALDGLAGLPYTSELVAEVEASEGAIAHALWVPQAARESARSTLIAAIPSLRITEAQVPATGAVTLCLRLFVATPSLLVSGNAITASRSLLTGLAAGLRRGERVLIRYALMPGAARPLREPDDPTPRQRELARAWRAKTSAAGFRVSGLVLIKAPSIGRARELAAHIENVLRGRRGAVGGVRVTRERGSRSFQACPQVRQSSGWCSAQEVAPLLGLPLGDAVPGVEVVLARELLVPGHVRREGGRRLLIGRDSQGERPVVLSPEAARLHLAIIAPTGAGKSTLLMRSILADIAGGYGGIVFDPKGDLVNDLLDRVPPEHTERIVVLDPSAPGPVPGLDLLGSGDPDTRTEIVLSALRGIYRDAWGVRIDSYLRMGLRTLAELPNPVLSDWMRLYAEPQLRRAAVARIQENPILAAQWRVYEDSLSAAEQFAHVAPALARITGLLTRPALRNIINQPNPKLSIPRLLAERKWLLVGLSPGALGESANDLLSAIVGYLVWTAVEQRVKLPVERRHPIYFYCDELQSLKLPVGVEVFLERSRGLGCGVVVATQGLARLSDSVRHSLLGNVASLIAMKSTGADEAMRLARELPGLQPSDLMGLGRFECAARIPTGGSGSGSVVVTGRTEGPPPLTGQAARIRALSAQRYGTDPTEIEAELRRRMTSRPRPGERQLGQTRRAT